MANQTVLRGGCAATPRDHIRTTYRNFFPPDARWMFGGTAPGRGSPMNGYRARLRSPRNHRPRGSSRHGGSWRAYRARRAPSRRSFCTTPERSALFDAICELPEYYLTRTETEILKRHAADIASRAGPGCALVEFGSGSSVKSRLLLDALEDLALYSPIDISTATPRPPRPRLRRDYPSLTVEPVCADYMALADLPQISGTARRLGFFPGSTIGNLEPVGARPPSVRRAQRLLGEHGALVLGVDLKKGSAAPTCGL
mgnify:CR=1 FL=1